MSSIGILNTPISQCAIITKYDANGNALWAVNTDSTSSDNGFKIATDMLGNVYAAGGYNLATKINSFSTISSGVILTSTLCNISSMGGRDSFIVKYNSTGQGVWATTIGGTLADYANAITTDTIGNIYVTGQYLNSTFINSYSTISNGNLVTSSIGRMLSTSMGLGTDDAFIVKYDINGRAMWATNLTTQGNSGALGNSITTDRFSNIYVTGRFGGSTTVNTYSTISNGIILTSSIGTLVSRASGLDAFMVKYDADGKALWGTTIGGTSTESGHSITTDTFGNIYIAGRYTTSTLINSYSTISNGIILTSSIGTLIDERRGALYEAFITKYDADGRALWATNIGGVGNGYNINDITTDIFGNSYITGMFSVSTTINSYSTISSGIILTSSIGMLVAREQQDVFIAKYDADGRALWATNLGTDISASENGLGITTDIIGNIYITGSMGQYPFINTFSTISNGIIITSSVGARLDMSGSRNGFVLKLNKDGQYIV
jgi:hypothetical protein